MPALDGLHGLEPRLDVGDVDADGHRDRGRGARIPDVVPAGQWQRDIDFTDGEMQFERRAAGPGHDVVRANVGLAVDPERDQLRVLDKLRPVIEVTIVGIQHGDLRANLATQDLAFPARDAVERAEPLEMRRTRVRNDDDVRLRERREVRDLAHVIRTHLDHREPVAFFDACEHQRHADVVVQVAVRRQGRGG